MRKNNIRRIEKLETKTGTDGIARFFAALSRDSKRIPSQHPPISSEKQAEIDTVWASLTDDEEMKLFELGKELGINS